ncbi:hypothetical protein PISMIDRAFT_347532 [Pisolithus microcarpus 441]|uniref:Uncharacterized protein n=1 Tax=Pisolithus microcarpus 441 TaxID=765257 RepID=A0A0C9YD26_9AGAM|nr:hypothetical protein PISMIDRAFT_347532 [Pisolithus microcarpus 441]
MGSVNPISPPFLSNTEVKHGILPLMLLVCLSKMPHRENLMFDALKPNFFFCKWKGNIKFCPRPQTTP